MSIVERLDAEIAKAEAQLKALRSMREAVELLGESFLIRVAGGQGGLSQLFESRSDASQSESESNSRSDSSQAESESNVERIVKFFAGRKNDWAETSEIIQATGIVRGIVGNVLYVAYRDRFESKEHPEHKRKRLWRLKRQPSETPSETPSRTDEETE